MEQKTEEQIFKENELTPVNVSKYQMAGEIVSKSMKELVAQITEGQSVGVLCQKGDELLVKYSGQVSKSTQNGISFPTCISVNGNVCHLSPLTSDPEFNLALKNGDAVRIEMGAHVDEYPCQSAHTVVVGATPAKPVEGKQADVIKAANLCGEAILRLLKPGNSSVSVIDAVYKISEEFGCKPVTGSTLCQIQRNELQAEKEVGLNPEETQKSKDVEFLAGEVYVVEALITSGEGKLKEAPNVRTTVYRRNTNAIYQLKMKTSRTIFAKIQKSIGNMAFSLRQFDDEKQARMGIVECQTHRLVTPYPVFQSKEGEYTAYLVYTVLLMPNGPLKLTSFYDETLVKSEIELKDEKLVELLKEQVRPKKNKKAAPKS